MNRRDGLSQRPLEAWGQVKRAIMGCWPSTHFSDLTVLVGVSGGADSVALLRALAELRSDDAPGRLVVAHFNHQLRGPAADADAEFVQRLARGLGVEFHLGLAWKRSSATNADPERKPSEVLPCLSEAALREQRYEFFETVAARVGARYLALAHTADDNVETVLHNLFRGTGTQGIAGIPRFRPVGTDLVIARPLLSVDKRTIVAGLEELGQPFCHDQTNDTQQWNRNWLRNCLLPLIRQRYPAADQAILRAAELVNEQHADVTILAERFLERAVEFPAKQVLIKPFPLVGVELIAGRGNSQPRRILKSVFVAAMGILYDRQEWPRGGMTRDHWLGLWKVYIGKSGTRLNLPGDLRATRNADGSVVVERLRPD